MIIHPHMLQKANKNTLYLNRIRNIALESFKIMHKLGPKYLHDLIEEKPQHYDIRSEHNVIQPKVNSVTYGMNSFRYKGAKIWNRLSENVKIVKA